MYAHRTVRGRLVGQHEGCGFTGCRDHAESFLGHAIYSPFILRTFGIKSLVEDRPAISGLFAVANAKLVFGGRVAVENFGNLETDELASERN